MKEIELPFDFNASDSDLEEYHISIPKGFKAEINKDNVVLKKVKNEDDKIKQKIIKLIKMSREVGGFGLHKWEADEMLAWLEKQVQKSQGKLELEEIKEEKVDNINKVEPKFKVCDWITNSHCTHQITFIDSRYWCSESWVLGDTISIDKTFHLWTIQDAKDGDVLYLQHDGKEHIIIYKGVIKERFRTFVSAYCAYNGIVDAFCFADVSRYADIAYGSIIPATKEQRNTLIKAMADAGYTFNFDKKELKKIKL